MQAVVKFGSFFSLITATVALGCGGGQKSKPAEYPGTKVEQAQARQPAKDITPPAPIQVIPREPTGNPAKLPTVKIVSPKNGGVVATGDVMVKLQVKNWDIAQEGKHVHLIVDNEPYIPIYDAKEPLNLTALVKENLKHDLEPGQHILRAFPGLAHHESIKNAKSFSMVAFFVGTPSAETRAEKFDFKAPLLTYSRPKGCVQVGTPALLDFYITNIAALSAEGYKVHYEIDGQTSGDLTDWAPYSIENMGIGSHNIRLFLVNKEGQPAPGLLNDTTRTINVKTTCPMPAGHAAPAAPPSSATKTEGEPATSNGTKTQAATTMPGKN